MSGASVAYNGPRALPDDYTDAWSRYKKLRNISLFAFFGYVPAMVVAALLIFPVFHTFTPVFAIAFAWLAGMMVTGFRLSHWRCPRCGKWFAATWWYNRGFFARKCVHCGLPKYAMHP